MRDLPPSLDPLSLYLHAVQHPQAEVGFLLKAYLHHRDQPPAKLKEDFAGTSAVACAWVDFADHFQAIAVEHDRATVQWARTYATQVLPADRLTGLSIVQSDVLLVEEPRVDIVAALNFSCFIYHSRERLRAYFAAARASLRPGGMLVLDAFGGPGAMRPGLQARAVRIEGGTEGDGGAEVELEYQWEQRAFDAVSSRIDCRIHFAQNGRRVMEDAFVYDWRLWSLPELRELLLESGFADVAIWCDAVNPATGQSDSDYQPIESMPAREDWVAYLVAIA